MRLEGPPDAPRLITITSKTDLTQTVAEFSARRVRELEALRLSGFVFKARSPSCGTGGVPLVNARGVESPDGAGLFARVFMAHFPLIPVEDEEHLRDPQVLQQFLERAAACRGAHAHG